MGTLRAARFFMDTSAESGSIMTIWHLSKSEIKNMISVQARLVTLSWAIFVAPALSGAAGDWPQWRGPDRADVSTETGLLKEWPAGGPRRAWLYKNAGNGYSGPAISGGKLFTMGTRKDAEILIALNANTGEELW